MWRTHLNNTCGNAHCSRCTSQVKGFIEALLPLLMLFPSFAIWPCLSLSLHLPLLLSRYDHTFELYSDSDRLYLFGTDEPESHREWVKSLAKVNCGQGFRGWLSLHGSPHSLHLPEGLSRVAADLQLANGRRFPQRLFDSCSRANSAVKLSDLERKSTKMKPEILWEVLPVCQTMHIIIVVKANQTFLFFCNCMVLQLHIVKAGLSLTVSEFPLMFLPPWVCVYELASNWHISLGKHIYYQGLHEVPYI